jgi:hypothetical protein
MNLQQYNEEVNARLINPIKKNIDRERRIEDGSYFSKSVMRAGVENERRVLPDRAHQPSMYGEDYEGKYDPVSEAIENEFGNKQNVRGGKLNIGKAFNKAMMKANPVTAVLGTKTGRKIMGDSGKLTNNYIMPAVVEAGKPIEYGVAGATGTLLGGPAGGMAAITATKLLNQKFLNKNDPSLNQKSQVLGTIAQGVGNIASGQAKSSLKVPNATVQQPQQSATQTNQPTPRGSGLKKPKKMTKKQQEIEMAIKILKKHKQI